MDRKGGSSYVNYLIGSVAIAAASTAAYYYYKVENTINTN